MANNHTYIETTYNGLTLHMIRTDASNITLKNLRCYKNLKQSGYYGINGGFFNLANAPTNPRRVISLAKVDGDVVGPNANDGNSNNWCGGGIIVWNGTKLSALFNNPVTDAADISGTSKAGTWAQGGISLWLGYSDYWNAVATGNGGTRPEQVLRSIKKARTGLVADMNRNHVYLIVTADKCNYDNFRAAIQGYFSITDGSAVNARYAGLMLDGSGSSQLRITRSTATDVEIWGDESDKRYLAEVIVLKDVT